MNHLLPIACAWMACGTLVWLIGFLQGTERERCNMPSRTEVLWNIVREPHVFMICILAWPAVIFICVQERQERRR